MITMNGAPKGYPVTFDGVPQPAGGDGPDQEFTISGTYSSTAAYQTIHDFGELAEDKVYGIRAWITMGSGGGGLIYASTLRLIGDARRPAGGSLAVNSTIQTDGGNLPGDTARLTWSGGAPNNPLLQVNTSRVDDIEWKATVQVWELDVDTT